VPWEVLVKQWALSRGTSEAVEVSDYAHEFIRWLSEQGSLLSDTSQTRFFRWAVRDYLLTLRQRIRTALADDHLDATPTRSPGATVAETVDEVMERAQRALEGLDDFPGLNAQVAAALCHELDEDITAEIDWVFDDVPFTDAAVAAAQRIAALLVHKTEPFVTDAVLTFAGYGEKDFLPSLHRLTVSGVVADVVRYYDESSVTISGDNLVTITPLGLTEAIHSFLRGISPQYRTAAHQNLDDLERTVTGAGIDPSAVSSAFADAHTALTDSFEKVEWDDFLKPMLDVVETLPMAELVRLADSLVGLAALRQVVRGDTSVGGPVDLARVTRDDGFEWVRKKPESLGLRG
jgi:hypothetical protein